MIGSGSPVQDLSLLIQAYFLAYSFALVNRSMFPYKDQLNNHFVKH